MSILLESVERAPRVPSKDPTTLFLLHGRAAEAKTIFAMEGMLNPELHIIALKAPFPSEKGAFEWFEAVDSSTKDTVEDFERFTTSEELLTAQIPQMMAERNLNPEKFFLLGFSQGAAMSFVLGLRGNLKPKGVVAMSGFLPSPIRNWPTVNTSAEYLITHGTNDEVLGPEYSKRAQEFLQSKGIKAEYFEYRGRHRMTLQCVQHADAWLRGRIPA